MTKKTHERKIQIGRNGGRYVWRVSKYSGRRYKEYLPPKTNIVRSPAKAVEGIVFIPGR